MLHKGGRLGLSTFGPTDAAWTAAEAVLLAYAPPQVLDARTTGRAGPFATADSTLGPRQLWPPSPTPRSDVLVEIESALEPSRSEDGNLHLTQQVRYTTATRP